MRFKKIGPIAMAAVIGMSVLAGYNVGKRTAGEALFDFSEDDGEFIPVFSDHPEEPDVE